MGLPARLSERLRNLRHEWRTWIEPRNVSVVLAVVSIVVLALGAVLIEPARERLPALSREPVRLFTGTMSRARDVFTPDRDDDADQGTQLVTTAGAAGGPTAAPVSLRPDEPVARLSGRTGTLTVAEVERLVRNDPDRADDLVFLPGVTVREATALLDRPPTRDQLPSAPPGSTTTSSTTRPTSSSSSTTTTAPGDSPGASPSSSGPWYRPFWPVRPSEPAPAPPTTVPVTTVPDTTVPVTTVPETTVPVTTVPETTVPETTIVPETTVPETTVPQTTVPQTTLPEIVLPEIVLPDIWLPDLVL